MKHFNYYMALSLLALMFLPSTLKSQPQTGTQASENILEVGNFEGRIDKTVGVPVYLTNTDEVVAAQFDVTLPFSAPSTGTPTLSLRADGHSASYSATGTRTYRVVVMSMENRSLRGNAGLLLRLPMQAYDDGHTDKPYPISISNIILTDRMGNNIATERTAEGNYIVNREALPDLTASDVVPVTSQCAPGGDISITYKVTNEGNGATRAGWTEKIYLDAPNGTRTFIGSQTYTATLAAETTLNRTYEGTLPTLLHLDGSVWVTVEVVPMANTGELLADQENNTATSAQTIQLGKQLFTSTNQCTVREGNGYVTLTLSRSGDWTVAESFSIDCSVADLLTCNGLTLPCTVTIPARSAGVTLRIAAVNDKIVRAREAELTIAARHGYEALSVHVNRIDDDRNPLTIEVTPSTLAEGQAATVTATRGGELTDALTLNVACSHATRFEKPFVLQFEPGSAVASTTVDAIDDDVPQWDADVRFSASATDYQTSTATLRLTDDDRPAISITTSQPSVLESIAADPYAQPLKAIVHRDRGIDLDAMVSLTSSSKDVRLATASILIPAGSKQVEVLLFVTDNSIVDGSRKVTLSAELFLSSERQKAPQDDRARSQCQLTVQDDESPYLTLTSAVNSVGEAGSIALYVRRYVSDTSAPLSITMKCNDKRVSFNPQPAIIPAGSTTGRVTLTVHRNNIEDDDADIIVTASGPDIADAVLPIHISDRSLPDAMNPTIDAVGTGFFAGLPVTVRATIFNYGTNTLPKGMTIDFRLASASQLGYRVRTMALCQGTTDKEIPAGGEETFEFETILPEAVGNWWIYANLNSDGQIAEFDTSNNQTLQFCPITIAAPFEVSDISAAPSDLLPGDVVTVTGHMRAVEGSQLNGQTVRVMLDGNGQRTSADTQINTYGRFSTTIKIDRSAAGFMQVKALAIGQTEPAKQTQVHVYNMSLNATQSRITVDENIPWKGTLKLRNSSGKTIHINALTASSPLPDGMELTLRDVAGIGSIPAGATIEIPYTVKGKRPSSRWQTFTVTASSEEGATAKATISYYCQATSAYLVFTPRALTTTMLYNAERDNVLVTVKNCGKKVTGRITQLISGDWVMTDFPANRQLLPGEEVTIRIRLLPKDYMHSGRTYKSQLVLAPENGEAAVLPITVNTTGTEVSKFTLSVTDVYGLAQADYAHVQGASVTVTNHRTGKTFLSGTVGADGLWTTLQMQEGIYDVTVKAPRHKSVTKQIAVGPGEDCTMDMLLPYKALVADFVVDQDLTTNVYTMRQYFDIDTRAPQAIVKATIPDDGFGCGSETTEIVLQNVGTRTATNIRLLFPAVAGYEFVPMDKFPPVLEPGEIFVLHVAYEGPSTGTHRLIAKLRMHYEFDIRGQMLCEEDDYQVLVGCVQDDVPQGIPTVLPGEPNDPSAPNDPNEPQDPQGPQGPEGQQGPNGMDGPDGGGNAIPGTVLPTTGCYATLEFDDLSDIGTGQPLHAVLKVNNGQKAALRNLTFMPQMADMEFEECTSRFTYDEELISGFGNDGSGRYRLEGNREGTLDLTFIPLAEAATDEPQTYYIGGLVAYTDSRTGIAHTATLPLIPITIVPRSEVELTYLIQRHFLADDFDTDAIEPAEPATFAMLAYNPGGVTVTGLAITSEQPVVIDNRTDVPVAYTTQLATVDGEAGNYAFTDFTIAQLESGKTLTAQWVYSSEQTSHVRDLSATADGIRNANSNAVTLTVNQTHELVRPITSPTATLNTTGGFTPSDLDDDATQLEQKCLLLADADAYLLNDIADEDNMPDALMTADGKQETLHLLTATIARETETGNYLLSVKSDDAGWGYGRLKDPTSGRMRLASVIRQSDGEPVSLANFWQTDRTPQSDYTMLRENVLHFADKLADKEESYVLHFEPLPGAGIEVLDVKLFTSKGNEVADGSTTTEPVKKIEIEFTGSIKRLPFNKVQLTAHDQPMSLGNATLESTNNNHRFTIDLAKLPEVTGNHMLTINASQLKGLNGESVMGIYTIAWTEDLTGTVNVAIAVAPDPNSGTISPGEGRLPSGKQLLKAEPAEGYEFLFWMDNETGQVLTTQPEFDVELWCDRSFTAQFAPLTYQVTIEATEHCIMTGSPSGTYVYGQQIVLAVQSEARYSFGYWEKNGQFFSDRAVVTDIVTGNDTYVAYSKGLSVHADDIATKPNHPVDIYTLTGIRIRHGVTDVNAALRWLPAGAYIVGGKKVVVRK